MSEDPTISDVLEAINAYASHSDARFDALENRMGSLESHVGSLESQIASVRSQMVTKDYLDEKLADLRGDITILIRKEDTKVKALVEILRARNVIDESDVERILTMEPFARV